LAFPAPSTALTPFQSRTLEVFRPPAGRSIDLIGCPTLLVLVSPSELTVSKRVPKHLPLVGFVRVRPSTDTPSSRPLPVDRDRPSGIRSHPDAHVPPSWFLTTSAVFSATGAWACCIPLPVLGFAAFHSCSPLRLAEAIRRVARVFPATYYPSKNSPRRQPHRVTAAVAFLTLPLDPTATPPKRKWTAIATEAARQAHRSVRHSRLARSQEAPFPPAGAGGRGVGSAIADDLERSSQSPGALARRSTEIERAGRRRRESASAGARFQASAFSSSLEERSPSRRCSVDESVVPTGRFRRPTPYPSMGFGSPPGSLGPSLQQHHRSDAPTSLHGSRPTGVGGMRASSSALRPWSLSEVQLLARSWSPKRPRRCAQTLMGFSDVKDRPERRSSRSTPV